MGKLVIAKYSPSSRYNSSWFVKILETLIRIFIGRNPRSIHLNIVPLWRASLGLGLGLEWYDISMCGAFRGHEVWSTKVVFLGEDLAGGCSLDIDRREL